MAKAKTANRADKGRRRQATTWNWRKKTFGSREDLLAYIDDYVRGLLGPEVYMFEGDDREILYLKLARFKLELSPTRQKPKAATAVAAQASSKTPKPLPPLRIPQRNPYFR